MWIMLNNAFLSIVESPQKQYPGILAVRARAKDDLERVFGAAIKVETIAGRDYAFRTFLPREQVAAAIQAAVLGINYGNFKDSVKENDRHSTYHRVWDVMADFQAKRGHGRPYQTGADGKAAPRPPASKLDLFDDERGAPYFGQIEEGEYPDAKPISRMTDSEWAAWLKGDAAPAKPRPKRK
jgi:hypothetical protein